MGKWPPIVSVKYYEKLNGTFELCTYKITGHFAPFCLVQKNPPPSDPGFAGPPRSRKLDKMVLSFATPDGQKKNLLIFGVFRGRVKLTGTLNDRTPHVLHTWNRLKSHG